MNETNTSTDATNRRQQILAMREMAARAFRAFERARARFDRVCDSDQEEAQYDRAFAALDRAIRRSEELRRALAAAEAAWSADHGCTA